MSDDVEGMVFPGSEGAANMLEWIDRVLLHLREGRVDEARALLDGGGWRALDLGGIPLSIRDQLGAALAGAARALADPHGSPGDAEAALLAARARFMPGA